MAPSDAQSRRFIELRKHRRLTAPPGALLSFSQLVLPIEAAEEAEGDGTILDLSPGGCKMNSEITLAIGRTYSLIIQLPSCPSPVTIEAAMVRWIGDQAIGFKFDAIQPEQEEHLREYLNRLRSTAA